MINLANSPTSADAIAEARKTVQALIREVNIKPEQMPGRLKATRPKSKRLEGKINNR